MRPLPTALAAAIASVSWACGSASGPSPSLAARFGYTVRRVTGDTLAFSGTSLNWWRFSLAGGSGTVYQFTLNLFDAVEPGDSVFRVPAIQVTAQGGAFQVCPPTVETRIGVLATQSVSATLFLQHFSVAVADSGRVTFRALADTVVDGTLDLWFSTPAPAFRLSGTFTAHGTTPACL